MHTVLQSVSQTKQLTLASLAQMYTYFIIKQVYFTKLAILTLYLNKLTRL